MARRHGAYKISFEMIKAMFDIPGDVYLVDSDIARGIMRVHVNGPEAPEVPEGGAAPEMPLDDTVRERVKRYTENYEKKKAFFNQKEIKGTLDSDGRFKTSMPL